MDQPAATPYEPSHPYCRKVWEQLGEKGRQKRLDDARRKLAAIEEVTSSVASGASEREAIELLVTWVHRTSYRRWKKKYDAYGFDGLIDWRMPLKPPAEMPDKVHEAICTLRRADPTIAVDQIVAHVAEHHDYATSETTVKRVLRSAGLSRRPGPESGLDHRGEQRLELGGMKLVEAADVQTGYISAMTKGVMACLKEALWSAEAFGQELPEADTRDRDEQGRFLSSYNERYRKGPQDAIGPGFASVDEKRQEKDVRRFHLAAASDEVIERKLISLLVSPLLGSGRWDGIRVPRGNLLEELSGFAYMPATLELFTRELKFLGVSSTLWEIHARLWLEQTRKWGDERHAAVLYIDGTNKPVWTELYSESTRVENVGRVMPGLELVSFNTGYGVPLWIVTHSGRAPLVKVVPPLLNDLQGILAGAEVGRIVVIDAEGNSVPFLKGLEHGDPPRGWVTRLKPSLIKGKRIFNRTNFQPYREGERIRMGLCDLNDPEQKGGLFRIRVLEIEHQSTGEITYLGASTLLREDEWKPAEIGDLYFDRWPNQEAIFRAVNQAVDFKAVNGYGKQLVDNVSVVTELDKLSAGIGRLRERMEKLNRELEAVATKHHEEEKVLRRQKRRYETVSRQVQGRMAQEGQPITAKLQAMSEEQQNLVQEVSQQTAKVEKLEEKQLELTKKLDQSNETLNSYMNKQEKLDSRRRIFCHDVELDSLFSLLKVGLTLLVTYVLKEYLGDARMEIATFLERVAILPARLRITPKLEILTFEYNHRDPDVMALLAEQCKAINALKLLMRSGRMLRIQVDPAPPPRRPPPKNRRTRPGDRFRKS